MEQQEGKTMKLIKSTSTTGMAALAVLLTHVSGALAGTEIRIIEAPEPGMLGLFAIGVIGIIAASRWRK